MQEYAQATGHNLDPLGPKPQLIDFYHLSYGQKDRKIAFVILGMAATGLVAYRLAKKWGAFKFKAFFCDLISWVFPKSFTAQCLRSATAPAATKSPVLWPTSWSISRKSRLSSGGKMRRPQCVSPRGCWLARPTSGQQLDSFLSLWLPHVGGWSGCWNTLVAMADSKLCPILQPPRLLEGARSHREAGVCSKGDWAAGQGLAQKAGHLADLSEIYRGLSLTWQCPTRSTRRICSFYRTTE